MSMLRGGNDARVRPPRRQQRMLLECNGGKLDEEVGVRRNRRAATAALNCSRRLTRFARIDERRERHGGSCLPARHHARGDRFTGWRQRDDGRLLKGWPGQHGDIAFANRGHCGRYREWPRRPLPPGPRVALHAA